MQPSRRRRPMVVVMGLDTAQADIETDRWRGLGAVVVKTYDAGGCLRLATSVGPDVIVLDRREPERLVRLLKAHPVSSSAHRRTWQASQVAHPQVSSNSAREAQRDEAVVVHLRSGATAV